MQVYQRLVAQNPSYILLGAGGIMVAAGISLGYLLWILGAAAFMVLHLFLLLKFGHGYHHILMVAASLLLLLGNIGLYMGQPLYRLVEAWTGFLVLFVMGERVEMARIAGFRFPASLGVIASVLLFMASAILGSGPISTNLAALAMIMLPISVMRYDVGLRFMDGRGFQRFLSIGLAMAYTWLIIGGFLWLLMGYRDLSLHTVFIGFTGTMILTHAPVIIPAIIRTRHFYSGTLYAPLMLLQASTIIRAASGMIAGGLLPISGILTILAVTAYIGLVISMMVGWRRRH